MLSHNIEIDNLKKQLLEVNKDINTIQNDINESNRLLRLKEVRLEQKQTLKISIENRINELNILNEIASLNKQLDAINNEIDTIERNLNESNEEHLKEKIDLKTSIENKLTELTELKNSNKLNEKSELNENNHIFTDYMDSQGFDKRDKKYADNQETINNNSEQINYLNNKINESKSFFKKADLKIQRTKLEIYNNVLSKKNVVLEKQQRVYLTFSRNVNKLENMPQKFIVSVNNIKLRNVQEKYENKIERTHEIEKYSEQLKAEGHKIKSKFFDKTVEFYTKHDDRTRDKYQKLLKTNRKLINSARQFYDSYDLTRNQERVLDGESLKYNDIVTNVTNLDGQNYLHDENGNLLVAITDDFFMENINKVRNNNELNNREVNITNNIIEPQREEVFIQQTKEESKATPVLLEKSIDEIKNVGRYGKVTINKHLENEDMVNNINQESIINESILPENNIIQFPNSNIAQEPIVNESIVQKDNIIQFPNLNTEEYNKLVSDMMEQNNLEQENTKGRAI